MTNIEHAIATLQRLLDKPTEDRGTLLDAMETSYRQGLEHSIRTIRLFCPETRVDNSAFRDIGL